MAESDCGATLNSGERRFRSALDRSQFDAFATRRRRRLMKNNAYPAWHRGPRRLVATALLGLSAVACGGGHSETAPAMAAVDVAVAPARLIDTVEYYEAGGVIQAHAAATLMSRIMAPIERIAVAPGDRVGRGQVLMTLDVRDLAANARLAVSSMQAAEHGTRAATSEQAAADAALALSQASYDRVARLAERKSATPQELDEVTAALTSSRARVDAARARLDEATAAVARARAAADAASVSASYGTIVAPFDGRVTEKLVEPGNMASPGMPLLRVESAGGFQAHVRLDESRAAAVRTGMPAEVIVGVSPDESRFDGTVAEVARAIASDVRAFLVKVDLPAATSDVVRTGTFARVRLAGPARQALVVPAHSVVRRGQVATVFVADADRARLRLVQVGAVTGGQAEVLAGLDAGEPVVVAPPPSLRDGHPVRISGRAPKEPR
jgi:multidrug efflux pump subunit AcrA (membrane-fusion protein)